MANKTQAEIATAIRDLAKKHSKELILHLINNEGSIPSYDALQLKMSTMDYLAVIHQYKTAIFGEFGWTASFQACRLELLRKSLGGNIDPKFIPEEFYPLNKSSDINRETL